MNVYQILMIIVFIVCGISTTFIQGYSVLAQKIIKHKWLIIFLIFIISLLLIGLLGVLWGVSVNWS